MSVEYPSRLMLSPVRRDLLTSFLGAGWSALVNLLAVPFYLRLMGIEAYGLVALFATLQAVLNLLDLGLSPTLNRTMAAYAAQPDTAQDARDLAHTIQTGYWALGGVVGLSLGAAAPFLASHWVKTQGLPPATVERALMLMAGLFFVQWPGSLYSGGLLGLQRAALLTCLNAGMTTLRVVGALLVLSWLSPSVTGFFTWQVLASTLQIGLLTLCFWRYLPRGVRPARFDPQRLRDLWRYAAGMSGTGILALSLSQLDKVILSKVLPLEMFGYYALAGLAQNGFLVLLAPLVAVLFPRFVQLVTRNDWQGLSRLYHVGCQLISVLALPAAAVVAIFSPELLWLWTRDAAAVENTHLVLTLLVTGTSLNVLMQVPYSLQLATGWTSLALRANLVGIVLLTPLTILLASRFGGPGAALVWVVLNGGYVLVALPLMHARLLRTELRRWYLEDVGYPLTAALTVVACSRALVEVPRGPLAALLTVGAVWAVAQLAAAVAAREVRGRLLLALRAVVRP